MVYCKKIYYQPKKFGGDFTLTNILLPEVVNHFFINAFVNKESSL